MIARAALQVAEGRKTYDLAKIESFQKIHDKYPAGHPKVKF